MIIAAVSSAFFGILVGLQLRVTSLVPAAILASASTLIVFLAKGDSVAQAALVATLAAVATQAGYLFASFAATLKEAPLSARASFATPSTDSSSSIQKINARQF